MTDGTPLDYDRLIEDYETGLVDTLRGFAAGARPFLELWVADEDPVRSIANMLDAAATEGETQVDLLIGPRTAPRLDVERLRRVAGVYGNINYKKVNHGFHLKINDLRPATVDRHVGLAPCRTAPPTVHRLEEPCPIASRRSGEVAAAYRRALGEASATLRHDGEPAEIVGTLRAEGQAGSARLVLRVDPQDHVIRRAGHTGEGNAFVRGLRDRLCALIEGLPILEAADHGTIRLEHELRDSTTPRPVTGVVTPRAADPIFTHAEVLVRDAVADYRARTGFVEIDNTYDPGPSPAWRTADEAARRARLEAAITTAAREHGFDPLDVAVVAIEHDVRIVVRLHGSLASGDQQLSMLALEAAIQQNVDRRLELHQEELKDANVIRRLSGTGEPQ